jgi:predicted RNase H-like nuclease
MSDTPKHYDMSIQPVEFIVKNDIPFREANIIKYVCRHREKGGVDDLLKAAHYLDMLIQEYPAEEEEND